MFRKWGVEYDQVLINEIIHRKEGSAAHFIQESYQLLTGKTLASICKKGVHNYIPPFAKPTVSTLIKNTLNQPDMLLVQDERTRESKTMEVVNRFNSELLDEKKKRSISNEMSSISRSNTASTVARSVSLKQDSKLTQSSVDKPTVTVREVQVKQLTSNIASLRAAKQFESVRSLNVANNSTNMSPRGSMGLVDAINSSVKFFVQTSDVDFKIKNQESPFADIMQTIHNDFQFNSGSSISDNDAACLFDEVAACIDSFHGTCDLRDLWEICSMFSFLMQVSPESSELFDSCGSALLKYAELLVSQSESQKISVSLEELLDITLDTIMPKFKPMLREMPTKRHTLLSVLGSFTNGDPTNRIHFIQKLYMSLNDHALFLHCLTILIFMEENLEASPKLLDLYAYYSLLGISDTSPFLRAASLAMFAVLVQYDPKSIPRLLMAMENLVGDCWWETQAQLLIVASKIMDIVEEGPALASTLELILAVFSSEASVKVRKVGLSYFGQHVGRSKGLSQRYLEVLMDMAKQVHDPECNLDMLFSDGSDELAVGSACGGRYHLPNLPCHWNSGCIANAMLQYAHSSQLQNLEQWHFAILVALVDSPVEDMNGEEKSMVEEKRSNVLSLYLYENYKFYVFIALCDPNNSALAVQLIKKWIYFGHFDIIGEESFTASLRLLYTNDTVECQEQVYQMLADLMKHEEFGNQTKALISNLCVRNPEMMENDILARLENMI